MFGPVGRFARRVSRAAKARLRRGSERVLELRYGVSTAEHVYHEELGLDTENRVWHDPSDWIAIRKALARLRVGPDDVRRLRLGPRPGAARRFDPAVSQSRRR